ncbi:VanZ family protein [Peribacillus asahii]|uniref:VanZ family protein n=1 Tax=Peribacillus asahii TaxID=228899 RepID=UPI0022003E85|nr:VanZ family protein [Peribacillus asahii]
MTWIKKEDNDTYDSTQTSPFGQFFILVYSWYLLCLQYSISTAGYKALIEETHTTNPNTFPDIHFTYEGILVSSQYPYDSLEFFIRKTGHVLEYMILTFVLLMILYYSKLNLRMRMVVGFVGSFLFAYTDEYHQTFTESRAGHFIDVYTFDLIGIILGITIYLLIQSVKRRP